MKQSYGFNSELRNNFIFIEKNVIIFISGVSLKVLNLITNIEKVYQSIDKGGIGALALHNSRKYIAVGEKGK